MSYNRSMDAHQQQPVVGSHIDTDPTVCGGKACVAGTRIRVWDIHMWHDLRGMSPAEIVADFPQLSLSAVYAALAYYHDNREELQRQALEDEAVVARLESEQGATKYTQLRDQVLRGKDGGSNPVSP
jgi:uncharacterized protein (DUF433 family)